MVVDLLYDPRAPPWNHFKFLPFHTRLHAHTVAFMVPLQCRYPFFVFGVLAHVREQLGNTLVVGRCAEAAPRRRCAGRSLPHTPMVGVCYPMSASCALLEIHIITKGPNT